MRKTILRITLIALLSAVALYVLRVPLLRIVAHALIREDPLHKVDAAFVLSGGGYDRGNEAAKIFRAHYANRMICTGANPVIETGVFGIDTLECDMTAANLRRHRIPDSCIIVLKYGTSTHEEEDSILRYCKKSGFKKVMVISSKLHTRRVNRVFREDFESAGIQLLVHGAPTSRFDEMHWWESEDGLIAVNNEWIKTIYYVLKY